MYSLCLVLISRNEAASIRRCLDSVRPWVDRMLVLDTGSDDDTVQIAREAGARVEHFKWVDDFSVARNIALDFADADWNLVLDADESIVEGGQTLTPLRLKSPDFVGAIRIDSDFSAGGRESSASSWISRLLPRGVRYTGRVHEHPVHTYAVCNLPIHVCHTGYRPGEMASKKGRNAALLERALVESPGDGYLLYQLGKDHSVYERFDAAVECFVQADSVLPPDISIAHDLLMRWLFALKKVGKHAQAVQLAESRMGVWEHSPDYWFVVGDLLLDWACEEPARAEALMPMIEASWLRCMEIGERPDLEGAVRGRGSYLAATNLAVIYDGLGRSGDAQQYRIMADELAKRGGQ